MSIRGIAQDVLNAGAQTEADKLNRLHDIDERSLARSEYYSFQAFWEAVQQQILGLARPGADPVDPEAIPLRPAGSPLPGIGKRTKRELEPLLRAAAANGRSLMTQFGEADYARRLTPDLLPDVSWTRRPVKGSFAYWAPRISGQAKGKPIIRINVTLRAPLTQVPDETLEYLLWHELCHQLLPGKGHDAEFRWLQSIWPDNARLDHDIDTLRKRYDLGWTQGRARVRQRPETLTSYCGSEVRSS